ncbi:hypothetical protein ACFFX0_32280 [Citricoccus parietis]|uniref:Secreted protein n=1 Tax=Citricoccus parietis TaxID=592307 RepID=A0ABV5G9I6_9MICC
MSSSGMVSMTVVMFIRSAYVPSAQEVGCGRLGLMCGRYVMARGLSINRLMQQRRRKCADACRG